MQFQKNIERFLNKKIIFVQSDWGGEYRRLNNFLQTQGINHRLTCPHTHHQNGVVERKHRHIVETGLALLGTSSVPTRFWNESFKTACHLINRLPTPISKEKSPYESHFQKLPDYNMLRHYKKKSD